MNAPRTPSTLASRGALVAASTAMLVAALVLDDPLAFALDSVALRAAMQYGTQELDRRAVALAGVDGRRANDLVGLAMRFGGMLVGPLWFGLVRDVGPATLAFVCALALLGASNAQAVASAPPPSVASAAVPAATLTPADRALLAAARVIYASFYLLASSMIYVLADVHHVASPVRRGGVLVTATYGSAVLATAVEMTRRAARRTPREMLAAPVLMAVVGLSLRASFAASTLGEVLGSVALGVAFARFMLAFRDHATWEAVHRGRTALLGEYNNLANTSALVGYAVMAALAAACHALGVSYASAAGYGVAALGAAAVPLTLAGDALRRKGDGHS